MKRTTLLQLVIVAVVALTGMQCMPATQYVGGWAHVGEGFEYSFEFAADSVAFARTGFNAGEFSGAIQEHDEVAGTFLVVPGSGPNTYFDGELALYNPSYWTYELTGGLLDLKVGFTAYPTTPAELDIDFPALEPQ